MISIPKWITAVITKVAVDIWNMEYICIFYFYICLDFQIFLILII